MAIEFHPNSALPEGARTKRTITNRAPTVTDDTTAGYSAWSLWGNSVTGEVYRCLDAAAGAAVWVQTTLTVDELGSAAMAETSDFATAVQGAKADTALQALPHSFNKQDRSARLFELSGTTLQTAQPVSLDVDGTIITLATGVAVTLPTLASHTDYMVYCSATGSLTAQPWDSAAPANARAIGGFHAYHTTATINPHSIWDLGYRPVANPRGMTQCPTGDWVDIYLMDVDYGINGYSRGGVTIADGGSPPKIPAIYGGNGTTTYGSLTWFEAVDLAAAAGKRLLTYAMFTAAAFGVVERQSVGADPVTTKYQAGHRSACGMEQATGCLWQWGEDINGTSATGTPTWQDITDGRGDIYTHSIRAVLLGAYWSDASHSGSRASYWSFAPSYSYGAVSARASCGHMTL